MSTLTVITNLAMAAARVIAILGIALLASCKPSPPSSPASREPVEKLPNYPALPRPAKEISAASGPLKLTLRLLQDRIQAGESLWYQVELRNIGDTPISLSDDLFSDPLQIHANVLRKKRTFIEIKDAAGNLLEPEIFLYRDQSKTQSIPPDEQVRLQQQVSRWRRDGLSTPEIQKRLNSPEFASKRDNYTTFRFTLSPSTAITTKPWDFIGYWQEAEEETPRGNYSELHLFNLRDSGKYQVRAVCDYRLPHDIEAKVVAKTGTAPARVRIETDWISFEIVP